MSPPSVLVQRLPHGEGLPLPRYVTSGAAGADVVAAVAEPLELAPAARAAVPTGLVLAIPEGFEVQVRPRSGLALAHGVTVANAPGTIDSDYRGEVKVILVNLGDDAVHDPAGRPHRPARRGAGRAGGLLRGRHVARKCPWERRVRLHRPVAPGRGCESRLVDFPRHGCAVPW